MTDHRSDPVISALIQSRTLPYICLMCQNGTNRCQRYIKTETEISTNTDNAMTQNRSCAVPLAAIKYPLQTLRALFRSHTWTARKTRSYQHASTCLRTV